MISKRWIGPLVTALAVLISLPTLAEVTASGYDRMDGDYIRPNRRATPKRNFNTRLSESDRLNVYSVKRNSRTRVDSSTGSARANKAQSDRILDQQNEPYSPDVNRVDPGDASRNRYARPDDDSASVSSTEEGDVSAENAEGSIATMEAEDVSADATSPEPSVSTINPETALVFCSKSLHEYHWDRACTMLKNVRPTPLTLISARNSNYVECTVCGKNRGQR